MIPSGALNQHLLHNQSETHQTRAVVVLQIFVTYRHQTPERLLRRHVHQQQRGDGGLGLAVALYRSVDGVGFEHLKQRLLSETWKPIQLHNTETLPKTFK